MKNKTINDIYNVLVSIDKSLKNISENIDYKNAQKKGIEKAKLNGKQIGRSKIEKPANFKTYKKKILNNEISIRKAAKEIGVSNTTLAAWIKEE